MTKYEIKRYGDNFEIIEKFKNYLFERLNSKTTPKQYINWIFKTQAWLIENEICSDNFDIWKQVVQIEDINTKLNNEFKDIWRAVNIKENYWYSSPWNAWCDFNSENEQENKDDAVTFLFRKFKENIDSSNLFLSEKVVGRFLAALLTKQFVIFTGLSGSGKTKLAQAFASWICEDETQYALVPVGADWTNREPLLGYPNALKEGYYVLPDNGALTLLIEASKEENQYKPYFLILDEMNLSHVERYFADFLSAMESKEAIPLHSDILWKDHIPPRIQLPENLFIIGTVNIDETTYMFSPKVLDRANVIEFRVTATEMKTYLSNPKKLDLESLKSLGVPMSESFIKILKNNELTTNHFSEIQKTLLSFFNQLKKIGAEFGYRSAAEILRFAAIADALNTNWPIEEIIDAAIMQKLLPKVHGSRRKLELF